MATLAAKRVALGLTKSRDAKHKHCVVFRSTIPRYELHVHCPQYFCFLSPRETVAAWLAASVDTELFEEGYTAWQ